MEACKPKTLKTQIMRGIAGLGFIIAAYFAYSSNIWVSVGLLALSFIPLRGCPVCWTVETCEVIRNSKKEDTAAKG